MSSPNASCVASCASADVDVSKTAVVIELVLILVAPLVMGLQFHKMHAHRSSAGVSLFTSIGALALAGANTGAAIVTKWNQMARCASVGLRCLPRLLDGVQIVTLALLFGVQVVMVVAYPPHDRARHRALAGLALAGVLGVCMLCALGSLAAPCGAVPLGWACWLGYTAAGIALGQYTPQLYETWGVRGSGSLSLSSNFFQACGGYATALSLGLLSHERWEVWAPWMVSTTMQVGRPGSRALSITAMLALGLYVSRIVTLTPSPRRR